MYGLKKYGVSGKTDLSVRGEETDPSTSVSSQWRDLLTRVPTHSTEEDRESREPEGDQYRE